MPKPIPLAQYVARLGSQEAAAREIGVSLQSVHRWLRGKTTPTGLAAKRLAEMGIKAG